MAIRDDIKKLRGLNNDSYNAIIDSYVSSAKTDLIAIGVKESKVVETDPLIYDAIVEFALARIDEPSLQQMHFESYRLIADKLRHYADYKA